MVQQILAFIGTLKGVELHKDKLFMIASELYNNALEHGILKLPSELKNTVGGFEAYYQQRAPSGWQIWQVVLSMWTLPSCAANPTRFTWW